MPNVNVVYTIEHEFALSVYQVSSMGTDTETDAFFRTRNPIKRYSKIGDEFKGLGGFTGQDNLDNYLPPILGRIETDEDGNKYAVGYVYDLSASGYHLYNYIVSPPDDFNPNASGSWADYPSPYVSFKASFEYIDAEKATVTDILDQTATTESVAEDYFYSSTGYHVSVEDLLTFSTTWQQETDGSEFFNSRAILGIFGLPYQFMPHVDPRIDTTNIGSGAYLTLYQSPGREYANHIVSNMPILFLSPGTPNFLRSFKSESDRNTIIDTIVDTFVGNDTVGTDGLLESTGKYYTFEYAVDDYYCYVNPACRIASAYMGVNNRSINGSNLDNLNWMDYTTNTLTGIFKDLKNISTYMSIPFYIESETQISESFGNDITDSTLSSAVDGISDFGRELMFVLGYGNSALNANINALNNMDNVNEVRNNIREFFGTYAEGNGFISNVINHLSSVATGGRLIFPKIWSNSSFNRSYDVTIKLRSPDMDSFSIYCNIIVPFLHLLCMVLPRQIDENPNGFYSPFIVRALYKGFFNVDMGIISSMSVSKGDTGMWNADGIPCSIDVTLTITDLYESMSMTPTGWTDEGSLIQSLKYDTLDNTCFMDYIANLCGINMYVPEIKRTLDMWLVNNVTNRVTDAINIGLWGNIQNSIANAITNVWRRS